MRSKLRKYFDSLTADEKDECGFEDFIHEDELHWRINSRLTKIQN